MRHVFLSACVLFALTAAAAAGDLAWSGSVQLPREHGSVAAWASSPDGSRLAVAFADRQVHTVGLCSPPDNFQVIQFDSPIEKVACLVFDPSGKYLLIGTKKGGLLYELATGSVRQFAAGQQVRSAAFFPEATTGGYVAIASATHVAVLDQGLQTVWRIDRPRRATKLFFSAVAVDDTGAVWTGATLGCVQRWSTSGVADRTIAPKTLVAYQVRTLHVFGAKSGNLRVAASYRHQKKSRGDCSEVKIWRSLKSADTIKTGWQNPSVVVCGQGKLLIGTAKGSAYQGQVIDVFTGKKERPFVAGSSALLFSQAAGKMAVVRNGSIAFRPMP